MVRTGIRYADPGSSEGEMRSVDDEDFPYYLLVTWDDHFKDQEEKELASHHQLPVGPIWAQAAIMRHHRLRV